MRMWLGRSPVTDPALASMKDVAAVYGKLLAQTDNAWREASKANPQLAALPDGSTVTIVVSEDDAGELDEKTERALAERITEADRGDAFVDAAEVVRQLEARRTKP